MKRFLTAFAALTIALSALLPPAGATTRTNDFAQTVNTSTKTSDSFDPLNGGQAFGFSVGVTGTFVAKWRLQRSLDAGVTWVDYFVFDQSDIISIPNLAPALWQVTAAGSGDFTSGSATVTFAKGGQASALMRLMNKDRTAVSSANPMAVGGVTATVGGTLTKSTKTTAYTSGLLITQGNAGASSAIAIAAARASDTTGMVRRARLKVNDATWLNATVRVHLFKDAPTFTNGDAANFAAGVSESNHICYIDVLLELSFSNPAAKGSGVPAIGSECNFEPSVGTQNIYAVLEARSTTAGSHTASSTFTLVLEVFQN